MSLGEAEKPESPNISGRPHEPDTGNTGVGNGKVNRIPSGMRFFVFMRLIINGEETEKLHVETVQDLLNELHIEKGRVAVEVNLTIVKKADYTTFRLDDGDKVEIVNFVGGG